MAKRRGNGKGSITHRKNGGWCAQYVVFTTQGRKRRTLYGKTRQEVATKLAKALSDREGSLLFDAGSLTVGEYFTSSLPLEEWRSKTSLLPMSKPSTGTVWIADSLLPQCRRFMWCSTKHSLRQ
jgi:hypothetical protein